MELFDKKFVHFMWDDELQGKKCFVSDGIDMLKEYVENDESNMRLEVAKGHGNRPFAVDWTDDSLSDEYQFAYYDPNYEAKRAFNEGKAVQVHCANGTWKDCDAPKWYDDCMYRIKPEEEKCIVYLQRYDEECWLSTCYECEWKKVQEEKRAKTKLFIGSEDEVAEWYKTRQKFAKVIKAWEDGKTIQYKALDTGRWCDFDPKLGPCLWNDTTKYRVKPEEKAVAAKMCSGCVHEHCSAVKEPCVSCKPGNSKYEARLCETCEHLGYSDDSEPCSNCSDENGYPNWKPVKKWRPYESSAEMIMDFIDRFNVICVSFCEPLVWVKDKATDARHLVTSFVPDSDDNDSYVVLFESTFNFDELFKDYTYLDGSPVGMEEKE